MEGNCYEVFNFKKVWHTLIHLKYHIVFRGDLTGPMVVVEELLRSRGQMENLTEQLYIHFTICEWQEENHC